MAQEEVHRHKAGVLLRHVHLDGAVSRAELAARMGLNRSTIMALITELAGVGLVREQAPADTGRPGRPSLVVRPASDRVYVLVFDVAADRLAAARVGLGGVILERREAVRARTDVDLGQTVEVLARFGRELYYAAPSPSACVGVGVSYCGVIRPGDGTVRFEPEVGWVDRAFGADLSRRLGLGLPVVVGNNAHLGAVAEQQRGAGTGFQNLVYLHGDLGIGGGIIVGGKLLDGDAGYACEVGHMVVNPYGGRSCGCGSRGCLEAEVGERALLDTVRRSPTVYGRDAVRAVVDEAHRGDITAQDALHHVGDWLGIGVANLINLFDPGIVVFGRMLGDLYPGVAARVHARIATNVLPVARQRVQLRVSALQDDTTLLGAAELAFSPLLTDPFEALAGAPSPLPTQATAPR